MGFLPTVLHFVCFSKVFEAWLFGGWLLGSIVDLLRSGTLEELGRPMGAETDADGEIFPWRNAGVEMKGEGSL